jgi:hypothetical protein
MRVVRRKEGDDGADTDRRAARPNTPEPEHGGDGLGFYERLGLHVVARYEGEEPYLILRRDSPTQFTLIDPTGNLLRIGHVLERR